MPTLQDQEHEAEMSQKQRAEGAFERGRQLGDRQAAAAITALKGELQVSMRRLLVCASQQTLGRNFMALVGHASMRGGAKLSWHEGQA